MALAKVSLNKLESFFAQCERRGIGYGLGAKVRSLSDEPNEVGRIDCSGAVRWWLYKASGGKLVIPDGSQNQRAFFEKCAAGGECSEIKNYADVNRYMTDTRLFICFIKPHANGCGNIGHVWLVCNYDADKDAETLESHGGTGVNTRPWNSRTLAREFYSAFEIPTE